MTNLEFKIDLPFGMETSNEFITLNVSCNVTATLFEIEDLEVTTEYGTKIEIEDQKAYQKIVDKAFRLMAEQLSTKENKKYVRM